jgi:hypothetical protein
MIRYITTSSSVNVSIEKSEEAEAMTVPAIDVTSMDFQSAGRVISTSPLGLVYLPFTSEVEDGAVVLGWLNDTVGIRNKDNSPKMHNITAGGRNSIL